MEGKACTSGLQEIPVGLCLGFFEEDVIYEAIVGSSNGLVRPLGLRNMGGVFQARIYHPSSLLGEMGVNSTISASFTDDALVYYDVLEGKAKTCLGPGGLPAPLDPGLLVLLRVSGLREEDLLTRVFLKPEACYYSGGIRVKPYTRANALLLEELIHYTRIKPYMDQGFGPRVFRLLSLIEEYASTISRIAPGSEYEHAARRIAEKAWMQASMLL